MSATTNLRPPTTEPGPLSTTPDSNLRARRRLAAALLVASGLSSLAMPVRAGQDWAGYVDPFIGTGGHGHTFPGATLPFGMVQLSPDTRLEGWDSCSGYHFSDRVIYGFSHTHLSGTGIADYGDILFMPMTGEPSLDNGHAGGPGSGYASRFDKRSERAEAGWYAVELADYDVGVELTATQRAGLHRYRYPEGAPARVIVDLTHRDRVIDSAMRIVGEAEIEGFRRSTGWARDQVVYFAARFSRPFTGAALARDDVFQNEAQKLTGTNIKGVLSFGEGGGELLIKVGISAVDVAGARRNLDAEAPGWDFDAVRQAARQRWNDVLGRIEIDGGSAQQRTIFYTALYHSLVAPNVFSDVDGRYRGMDRRIHRADGRRHYTVFSLWDTFRATHPLYTLIEPERTREFIETFLTQYEQGGRLPVWELAAYETDTMIGYHAVSVIADAWLKGIRGFDGKKALEAMIHSASLDHFGLAAYRGQGFIGSENDGESVSKTLEYAYDDWCIARMAADLGRDDAAAGFFRRSQAWRHLLDPETGFMRARRNQRWVEPFDPRRVDNNYTEANAWQYSFFVPHDVEGLIEALGGDERFVERLEALFAADSRTTGREQADITGLIGQYAHGNEPSHHMAWLYHYAGRPDLTARRVRQILDTLYAAAPDGLSGNEDCGQMSSWYVLGAMGLYPVCPGSDEYVVTSPIFDRIRLHLDGGRQFTIRAGRANEGVGLVRAAALNGQPLRRSFLRHQEIIAGGELMLTLTARPGSSWGAAPADRPRSSGGGERVLAAPFVRSEGDRFRGSLSVALTSADAGAVIRYALEPVPLASASRAGVDSGSLERSPRATGWQPFREPIVVRDSSRLRFVAEQGDRRSPVVEALLHRIPNDWRIGISSVPNSQYTAGGPDALIDGLRGQKNWRTGDWQGYQYSDFEATVDLGEVRPIRRAGAGFLQDVRSWIWMPSEVVLSVSTDGIRFREAVRLGVDIPEDEYGVIIRDWLADLGGIEARYLRVLARNYGTIPDWHPGSGDGAFIFIDEILVE
jgi:predicted alpha-1,2-mannosidase